MRYYFIIVLLIYIIVKFLYDIFMSKKNMFSSNAYYMSFLISKLMFIICFISVLYSIYMGKTLSGYFGILWFITIYVSTYYITDTLLDFQHGFIAFTGIVAGVWVSDN